MTVVTLCLGAAGGNARVRLLPGEYSLGRRAQDVDIVPYDDKSVRRVRACSAQLRARKASCVRQARTACSRSCAAASMP